MPLKDLEKLTVVKLRAELIARGLDPKGNKPFLVERLHSAIELEEKNGYLPPEIANTSMDPDDELEEELLKEEPNEDVKEPGTNGTPQGSLIDLHFKEF